MTMLRDVADSLDGLFAGQLSPEEYEPLIKAGLLFKSYEGVAGLLGVAILRKVIPPKTAVASEAAP